MLLFASGLTAVALGQPRRCNGKGRPIDVKMPLRFVVFALCLCHVCAMEPLTSAERERAVRRAATDLPSCQAPDKSLTTKAPWCFSDLALRRAWCADDCFVVSKTG